jgi:hypothetical protein
VDDSTAPADDSTPTPTANTTETDTITNTADKADTAVSAEPAKGTIRVNSTLDKEQFQTTMHFLLSFVQKDKQADALLERLLLRLAAATGLKQRRNLAFCISELTITNKGVKKVRVQWTV